MKGWAQLYIRTTRTPRELQHVEPLLMRFGATFVAPAGLPIQTKDDMYEVRVYNADHVRFVERILADQELPIADRVDHPPEEI